MSEENKTQSAEVIQGPWKKSSNVKRKIKLADDAIKLQENIDFVNNLTQTVIVQMIHTIRENEINVEKDSFVRNMSFIIEMVRAALLKEKSLNTNMTKIMDILFETIFNSGGNIDDLKLIIDEIREDNDDDPEVA